MWWKSYINEAVTQNIRRNINNPDNVIFTTLLGWSNLMYLYKTQNANNKKAVLLFDAYNPKIQNKDKVASR